MKKKIVLIIFVGIFFAITASAQVPAFLSPGTSTSISEFIKGFYDFALIAAGVLAVGMIVVGGIYYSISGAVDKKGLGKEIIVGALWGLLLLLSAYIILRTVNPSLVDLAEPALEQVEFSQCTQKIVKLGEGIEKELPKCDLGEWPLDFETGKCKCYVDENWKMENAKIANEPDSDTVERVPGSVSSKGRGCMEKEFGSTYNEIKSKLVSVNCAGTTIRVHEKAKQAFETACSNIPAGTVVACGKPLVNSSDFRWSYVAGSKTKKLSYHAFGVVVDFNAWDCSFCDNVKVNNCYAISGQPESRVNKSTGICSPTTLQGSCTNTNLPNTVINAFKNAGFGWGGDWVNKKDNMHFEWFGPCKK